jgi:hypothetical protein
MKRHQIKLKLLDFMFTSKCFIYFIQYTSYYFISYSLLLLISFFFFSFLNNKFLLIGSNKKDFFPIIFSERKKFCFDICMCDSY